MGPADAADLDLAQQRALVNVDKALQPRAGVRAGGCCMRCWVLRGVLCAGKGKNAVSHSLLQYILPAASGPIKALIQQTEIWTPEAEAVGTNLTG